MLAFLRILFLSLFLCGSLQAKELIVAVINLPPFGFSGESPKGIHVEYMEALLNNANIEHKIIVEPYPRVISSLQQGKVDLTLLYKRQDLKNVLEVAKSIGFKNYVISRKESPLRRVRDLEGKKITVVRTAKYEEAFDVNKDIIKVSVNNYLQSITMVANGRVDGGIISEPALVYYKKQNPKIFKSLVQNIVLNSKYNYIYAHENVDKKILQKIADSNKEMLMDPPLKWFLETKTGKKGL